MFGTPVRQPRRFRCRVHPRLHCSDATRSSRGGPRALSLPESPRPPRVSTSRRLLDGRLRRGGHLRVRPPVEGDVWFPRPTPSSGRALRAHQGRSLGTDLVEVHRDAQGGPETLQGVNEPRATASNCASPETLPGVSPPVSPACAGRPAPGVHRVRVTEGDVVTPCST